MKIKNICIGLFYLLSFQGIAQTNPIISFLDPVYLGVSQTDSFWHCPSATFRIKDLSTYPTAPIGTHNQVVKARSSLNDSWATADSVRIGNLRNFFRDISVVLKPGWNQVRVKNKLINNQGFGNSYFWVFSGISWQNSLPFYCTSSPNFSFENAVFPAGGKFSGVPWIDSTGFAQPILSDGQDYRLYYSISVGSCTAQFDTLIQSEYVPFMRVRALNTDSVENDSLRIYSKCTNAFNTSFDFRFDGSSEYVSYQLDFGDGSPILSGNVLPPSLSHNFSRPGLYFVDLTGTNTYGCSNTLTIGVYFGMGADVDISANPAPGNYCNSSNGFSTTIQFGNIDSNRIGTLYTLSFNDGSPDRVFNHPPPPAYTHTFLGGSCNSTGISNNQFEIKVRTENPCGLATDSLFGWSISNPPIAEADISDSACVGVPVKIAFKGTKGESIQLNSGQTSYSCDTLSALVWDIQPTTYSMVAGQLGDKLAHWNTGTDTLLIQFNQKGNYTLRQWVKGNTACGNDSIEYIICVEDVAPSGFSLNQNRICTSDSLRLNHTFSDSGSCEILDIRYVLTRIQNGQSRVFTGSNLSIFLDSTYVNGKYIVKQEVESRCGIRSSYDTIIMIGVPRVFMPASDSLCGPNIVHLGSSTWPITLDSSSGNQNAYRWTVKSDGAYRYVNGTDSSFYFPAIELLNATDYRFVLDLTNECFTGKDSLDIRVLPQPRISGLGDSTVCLSETHILKVQGRNGLAPYTYEWKDSNQVIVGIYDSIVLSQFVSKQRFNIKITDSKGCSSDTALTFKPTELPFLEFDRIDTICYNSEHTITILDSSQSLSIQWLDPSKVSLDQSFTTTALPITDDLKLFFEITDARGCHYLDSLELRLLRLPSSLLPDSQFFCLDESFTLLQGDTTALSYSWTSEPPGFFSTLAQPTVSPLDTTTYIVQRTHTLFGCIDTLQTVVYPTIIHRPNGFDHAQMGCSPMKVHLANQVQKSTNNKWYINGLLVSTADSLSIEFINRSNTQDSSITISWAIESPSGCTDSLWQTWTIQPKPRSFFTLSNNVSCSDGFAFATAQSNVELPAQFNWRTSSSLVAISDSIAAQTGIQFASVLRDTLAPLQLITISAEGCRHDTILWIPIGAKPLAHFNLPGGTAVCGSQIIQPLDSSIGSSLQHEWKVFPSPIGITGANTSQPNIQLAPHPNDSVLYRIRLIVVQANGCSDSLERSVMVFPRPLAQFQVVTDSLCASNAFQMQNLSSAAQSSSAPLQWQWYSSSGDSSTAENPNFLFQAAEKRDTNYRVYLRVQDAFGCEDTSSLNLTVLPKALAKYSANTVVGCAPFVVETSMLNVFTDSLLNNNYHWEIRNPVTQTLITTFVGLENLRYVLSNPNDSVLILLIAQSAKGCSADTFGLVFRTLDKPNAAFQLNDSVYCSPATVSRIDSSIAGLTHAWYANSVLVSTTPSPLFQWTSIGTSRTVEITHTVSNTQNCIDSAQTSIQLFPRPDLSLQFTDACVQVPIQFGYQNIQADSIVDVLWIFGDGDSSHLPNPIHAFSSIGHKQITLIATNSLGCSQLFSDSLEVFGLTPASFSINGGGNYSGDTVCVNQNFNLSATTAPEIVQWQWDIGSDGSIDYLGSIAQHMFTDTASNLVALYVTNQFGCTDTLVRRLFVRELPVASFQRSGYTACQTGITSYSNTSNGDYTSFVWKIIAQQPNGNWNSIDSSNSQVFNLPTLGLSSQRDTNYVIELTLRSKCGAVSITDTLLFSPNPIAFATANKTSGCSPFNTSLSLNGRIKGNPDYVLVDWGDGSMRDSILPTILVLANGLISKQWPNLSHPYSYNGPNANVQYNLSVKAVNGCGQSTFTIPISVTKRTLQASFTIANPAQCAPSTFNFVNTSTGGPAIVQWCFNYDTLAMSCINGYAQGPITSYTYTNPGSYTIAQFITNGCSVDTSFQTITLFPAPQISFSNSSPSCSSDSISFNPTIILSSGSIVGVKWLFGDGDSAITANPVHRYASPGTYSVCLEVTTDQGCKKQFCKNVLIRSKPTAGFTSMDGCLGATPFIFNNNSTAGSGTLGNSIWDFGDGQSATGLNSSHTYNTVGSFTVRLIQFNSFGCSDTLSLDITVADNPNGTFSSSVIGADSCTVPVSYQFTVNDSSLQSYLWDFDYLNSPGVATSSVQNPIHTFTQSGVYTVQLIVQNVGGCIDTQYNQITVYPQPELFILNKNTVGCSELSVAFSDSIRVNGQNAIAIQYEWNFGDGNSSNAVNPTHTYAAGKFLPSLRVQMPNGCWFETPGDSIEVYATPNASFTTSATSLESYFFNYTGGLVDTNALFFWDFGDGNSSQQRNPEHTYTDNFYETDREYLVCLNVISSNGCDSTICKELIIRGYRFNIPNAFAPDLSTNSVGDANLFLPKGHALKEYKLEIFDPEGNLVFQTSEIDENGIPTVGWNGRVNNGGDDLPMGVYVWKIEARYLNDKEWEGKEFGNQRTQTYGTVTLIR